MRRAARHEAGAGLLAGGAILAFILPMALSSAPAPGERHAAPAPTPRARAEAPRVEPSPAPEVAAAAPSDEVPLAKILHARRPPPVVKPPAPEPAPAPPPPAESPAEAHARTLAFLTKQVLADPYAGPFLRAARDVGLDPEREERLVALLRTRCERRPPAPPPPPEPPRPPWLAAPEPAAPEDDPVDVRARRAALSMELIRPLHDILGEDTGRVIGAALGAPPGPGAPSGPAGAIAAPAYALPPRPLARVR
jgi:hypothetical protein